MTNNSPLDEHIKKQFGDYSPDVPGHIWEHIMAEKEKRKPVGFWLNFLNNRMLFILSMVLIAGGGIAIYTYRTASSKTNNTAKRETVGKTNTFSDIENNPGKANQDVSIENKDQNKINDDKNILTDPRKVNDVQSTNNAHRNIAVINKNKTADNSIEYTSPANDAVTGNSRYKKPVNKKGAAFISFQNPTPESGNDVTENTNAYTNTLLLNRMLLNLDMLRAQRAAGLSVTGINNPHLNVPCPAAEKDAAGNKKYLEIYAGPDYAFRSIRDTANSVYLKRRKESTSFSSAFSAGIRYTRVFSNGMSFRTGINYSQINEKFIFAEGNIIQVVYTTNSNGDTTGSYTSSGTRYKTTHNKFRTLDVPILVGYEMGNGRLHVNFNAGAVVNIYSWQKGDVLDTAYQPVNITTGKSSSPYQFKTNVGIGFMGAVSVYYKLTERLHLLAEPYFRYNFSAASKAELTLKQKYNTAGLRLGVRIDF